jgi:hypothetical protein
MSGNIFDRKVKIQDIIDNQLPEFIVDQNPNSIEFFKQYYKSLEFPGGPVDISDNLDNYIRLDNLIPEIVSLDTSLSYNIDEDDEVIYVDSTKGYPNRYGLLKIDDEIITYTGITTNSFTGCIRGFSGITDFHKVNDPEELVFSQSNAESHSSQTKVINLSSLFLKEFYKKIKYTYTPGLENIDFSSEINIGNFIKEAKSFYQAKGTPESFKILFRVLYGEEISVIDLEKFLIKPSSSEFIRRKVIVVESLSGNPLNLVGQTIQRSDSPENQASVSEVKIINRNGKIYYELSLFVGYGTQDLITGEFFIHPKTRVLENVSIGSSIISVDSTIGFPKTGLLVSGNNIISYGDKTVNQFLNCTNIVEQLDCADDIRVQQFAYGYENGDTDKKVEMRITGVISGLDFYKPVYGFNSGDFFGVKSVGEIIPNNNDSFKQIFANSWIYNTSSRYQIESILGSSFKLKSPIDKSSLKVGDNVEILYRGTQTVAHSTLNVPFIVNINTSTNTVEVSNLINFNPNSGSTYFDIRRKIDKAISTTIPIEYGNDNVLSNIQNVYNENDEYLYVSANGLPSYTISENIIEKTIPYATEEYLDGKNATTGFYSLIKIVNNPFKTGDYIIYNSSNDIPGLTSGELYYVEVTSTDRIRLYESKSFIGSSNFVNLLPLLESDGPHTFTLGIQRSKEIGIQKILRKFPIKKNLSSGERNKTKDYRSLGLLKNGVEILNYSYLNKIYYGPLKNVLILNSGENYDVINLPRIQVSSPSIGSGVTALIQPVVSGSVKEVLIDPQDFDIEKVLSVTVEGGNGTGCKLEPFLSKRFRSVSFDGRQIFEGGGIDITNETITFLTDHNFKSGEKIIYNSVGNDIGIGIFGGSNLSQERTLVDGSSYYASIVNNKTIQIYETLNDYVSGINTVGFTTQYLSGIHQFGTVSNNTLNSVKVIDPGSNYTNRTLFVGPTGISTIDSTVTFTNHNFNDGDLIEYYSTGTPISGISTTNQYYILKIDNDTFRLANAGTNKDTTDYNRKKFATFKSSGSGFNVFKYPEIKVNILVSYGSTFTGNIVATPVVRGKIVDAYLYESGVGYGSSLINFEKKPFIFIKTGKDALLRPVIINGSIVRVEVESSGTEYYSTPDLLVVGDGVGCKLRPVIVDNKIVDVIVLSSGVNYTLPKTSISVIPAGYNALLDIKIRDLSIDSRSRFGNFVLQDSKNKLQYGCISYDTSLFSQEFNDNGDFHSPIIGWAYDGNPIYGPYGHSDPEDLTSDLKVIESGYILNTNNIQNRPSTTEFPYGTFVEDYIFNNSGDLDIYNGRWCKTPEFPNGTYAYFATVNTINNSGIYPYFIGEYFRSPVIIDNFNLDQDFDFENSKLIRNTFPYKSNEKYADNDFIVESNEIVDQKILIESVSSGSIDKCLVETRGSDYKVGDFVEIDNSNTNGGGFSAKVSQIYGKEVDRIDTEVDTYDDFIFTWTNTREISAYISTSHQLFDNDIVTISGLSTFVNNLSGSKICKVESDSSILLAPIPSGTGIVTDIYLSSIPSTLFIDDVIQIDNENLTVLNIFDTNKILRVKRTLTGIAHTLSTPVSFVKNKFKVQVKTDYFESKINDKVYFNPQYSVGIGTTSGLAWIVPTSVGEVDKDVSVPTQSIYLPNHPFKTGQEVTLSKPPLSSSLLAKKTSDGASFSLPNGDSERVYIIKKSNNYIGLCTNVELTTSSDGLFFVNNGSDEYEYYFESNYTQVTGKVERITASITLKTEHNLEENDIIDLNVQPKTTVGIGTSSSVKVIYDDSIQKILINPIGFSSSGINTATNEITVINHNFNTGDKVYYKNALGPIPVGLQTGSYYIYRINSNKFSFAETLYDLNLNPPNLVSIASSGGSSQFVYNINPQINITKNNSLKFDLSDTSLFGYEFKLYYDKNFNKEFKSTESSEEFITSGIGTVGLSTDASFTLDFSTQIPDELFYSLEKDGVSVFSDVDVVNYSKLSFVDSKYNGRYSVTGIGSTTFSFTLLENPIILGYSADECDILEYSTTSKTENGGVNKINIISNGFNYKKLPTFSKILSENGKGASIRLSSSSIGKVADIKVFNQGYDYSVDNTLNPQSYFPTILELINTDKVESIEVLDGGKNYISEPSLVILNSETREVYPYGQLKPILNNSSIGSVEILETPYGLSPIESEVFSINNTNGIPITSVSYNSSSGIVTCIIETPVLGFPTPIFSTGDLIFVEGIQNTSESGDGFNSSDYGYVFFEVYNYFNTNPAVIEYKISNFSSDGGTPSINPSINSLIVDYSNYPKFKVTQNNSKFTIGEKVLVKEGEFFVEKDLQITSSGDKNAYVDEKYDNLEIGNIIKGKISGVIGEIKSILKQNNQLNIDSYTEKDFGWQSDVGKLNDYYQVTIDSDYYQNLSYSIKSSKQYDEISSPVNQLLHPIGLKNFADTQVSSSSTVGVKEFLTNDSVTIDYIDENRVDTINNFDLVLDTNVVSNYSKFLRLKNKKLTDYIDCISNVVLKIDNIQDLFSNVDNRVANTAETQKIITYTDNYSDFLIQIKDPKTSDIQLIEISTLNDLDNIYILEKANIFSTENKISDINGFIDFNNKNALEIIPDDPFDTDLDVKILKSNFSSVESGIGTYSIGLVNLSGIAATSGIGSTVSIISFDTNQLSSVYVSTQIIQKPSGESNFVDIYLTTDGTDSYISEYYFDTLDNTSLSSNSIGTFSSYIDSQILTLTYENSTDSELLIRSKVVGFGSTASGIGTYIFLSDDQPEDSTQSVKYDSNFSVSTGTTTIVSEDLSSISAFKTIVKVSIGNTSALHQVLTIHNSEDVYTKNYPFLSINNSSGIGTFGGRLNGTNVELVFYPDSEYNSSQYLLQSFNQAFYSEYDSLNTPNQLEYGKIRESVSIAFFNAINGDRYSKNSFPLEHKNFSIFEKTFNPTNSSILDPSTGIFTIKNHFFSTGERLIYTEGSTFNTISPLPLGIGSTLNSVGVLTTILPKEVYAIKIDEDKFRISTRYDYSTTGSGIGVTFTSLGSGNAHKFEMYKKLEKTVLSLDGVVQNPIKYTPISHTLQYNGGQVGIDTTIFSLSGISSVFFFDVLKIDDEYVDVVNVGLGQSRFGPITGIGTFKLVEVERGFIGSSATSHTDSTNVRVYRGAYNIKGSKIYFTNAPKGRSLSDENETNLPRPASSFNGRVFLRQDYTTNVIYDDISDQFTGIGVSMNLTVQGINTTGVQPGSNLVFINDIFQTPSTENNSGNNYETVEESGKTKIVFTGITSSNGQIIVSETDVNQNQLPRGGIIVSLGSTDGIGFAPLVGASVTASVSGGTITSIGIGTTGNWGSGYNKNIGIVSITDSTGTGAVISAIVGLGGTLSFNISNGGSGYTNPQLILPEPSYENLPVIGVSRLSTGITTETGTGLLMSVEVGPSYGSTGIGSTYFSVNSFKITRPGYGFEIGDVFKPVGLVTDARLANPISDFTLTVTEIFTDSFSAIELGELDYIDTIKFLQDGERVRFPLIYQGNTLSFETNNPILDLNSVLLIFIDGVIQDPGVSYQFSGGSSFTFTEPPKPENNIAIFFYRGTRGVDSNIVNVVETLKVGDTVQAIKNDNIYGSVSQNPRTIVGINTSDEFETNIYFGPGIETDEPNYKILSWTKQKSDYIINGQPVYKSRNSLESRVYPTAKIIKNVNVSDSEVFVDDSRFFLYEENESPIDIIDFDVLIVENSNPVSAGLSAVVSVGGTIQSISIINPGSGYTGGSIDVKISAPPNIMSGIGSIASAVANISNGSVSTPITITSPGFGYDPSIPVQVIVESPAVRYENIRNVANVEGFSGIVTGITTTTGTLSNPLALKFNLRSTDALTFDGLEVGYPIYIYDTKVGSGVTSIDSDNSAVIGVGTQFLNNIYYIHSITKLAANAEIICNVKSDSSVIGISTFGSITNPLGRFSWGRLSNFERLSPIGIAVSSFTINSGLSSFPVMQRRGYGFEGLGALRPNIPI